MVAHKADPSRTYTIGYNKFSDWTPEKYAAIRGLKPKPEGMSFEDNKKNHSSNATYPVEWDWRNQGAVNPIQDQGQCGSCWAFGSTASMEGAYEISTGTLLKFSEQQLVDCDTACYGCNGGWAYQAFIYF